jgi:predicted phage tail protein
MDAEARGGTGSDLLTFEGGGKKGSSTPTTMNDTIRSTDSIEVILGLGEGPWYGLEDGPKSFYLDETPLVDPVTGENNFSTFWMQFNPGSSEGETIKSRAGGLSSSVVAGVVLSQGTAVTRSGQQENIDFIEVRFAIQQLVNSDSSGQSPADLELKIEYKAENAANWTPAFIFEDLGSTLPAAQPPSGDIQSWELGQGYQGYGSFASDRPVISQAATPATPSDTRTLWLNSSNTPHLYRNGSWQNQSQTASTWDDDGVVRSRYVGGTEPPLAIVEGSIWAASPTGTLLWNGASWVTPNNGIETATGTAPNFVGTDGVYRLREKISSTVVKEVRFPVPNIAHRISVRVTKLSPNQGESRYESVTFESFQEVKAKDWVWPNTATLQLTATANDQFQSVDTFQGIYKGLICKVPTNFNPDTRVYTGVWDGTYKMAWTDSLPWLCMEVIENTRWGMSAVYPLTCNKWSFYAWAQWCDTMVTEAAGTRPRVTFNSYIQTRRSVKELASFIAGAGFAQLVEHGDGYVDVIIDKDDTAVALFTEENIVGEFSYTWTDPQTRPNHLVVRYANPDLFWKQDARTVRDVQDIADSGLRPSGFVAEGCISTAEALARARYRLVTALTETESVSFTTNRKGRALKVWDVILVSDPQMGTGRSGRIQRRMGARKFFVRDAITFESGINYFVTFERPNPDVETTNEPFVLDRVALVTTPGRFKEFTTAVDVTDLPSECVFTIEAQDHLGLPKPYRVQKIDRSQGSADDIQIVALELNRSKWQYIDGTVTSITPAEYTQFKGGRVEPPAKAWGRVDGRVTTIFWEPSPTLGVTGYNVFRSTDGGEALPVGFNVASGVEILDLPVGIHVFSITAVGSKGKVSRAVYVTVDQFGGARRVYPPVNLRLPNGTAEFTSISPIFSWTAAQDPNRHFSHYRVEILNGATLLRAENTSELSWQYSLDEQKADGGLRTFKVQVKTVDITGTESAPTFLTVTRPSPTLGTVDVQAKFGRVIIRYVDPDREDFMGSRVWASPTATVTINDASIVYSGYAKPDFSWTLGEQCYLKIAALDVIGPGTPSNAVVTVIPKITGGDIANTTISEQNLIASIRDKVQAGGTYETLFNSLAAADSSLNSSVSYLTSTSAMLSTSITNLQNANASLSTSVTNLTSANATLTNSQAGLSTSISQVTSSISTLSGQVASQYFLRLTAAGHIGGFGLSASTGPNATPTISAVFDVDNFSIAQAGTNVVPFRVSGGQVYIRAAVIEDGSIHGDKITARSMAGDELSATARLVVGSGTNSLTISGDHSTWGLWAGDESPAFAKTRLSRDGTLITRKVEIRDENDNLLLTSANGFASNTVRTQTLVANAATKVSAVTEAWGLSVPGSWGNVISYTVSTDGAPLTIRVNIYNNSAANADLRFTSNGNVISAVPNVAASQGLITFETTVIAGAGTFTIAAEMQGSGSIGVRTLTITEFKR